MERTTISAADALKAFKTKPTVQTARMGKIDVKDADGKVTGQREGLIAKDAELAAAHILSAVQIGDRVVIVTCDGKKHEARVQA